MKPFPSMLVGLPVLLAAAALPRLEPAAVPAGSPSGTSPRARLLGTPVTELMDRLAPPDVILPSGVEEHQRWLWGARGADRAGLQILGGLVVHVDEGFDPEAHPVADRLPRGPFVGQAVSHLLGARGPAEAFGLFHSRSPLDGQQLPPQPYLVYDGRWAFVDDGVVVRLSAPIPKQKLRGPRK